MEDREVGAGSCQREAVGWGSRVRHAGAQTTQACWEEAQMVQWSFWSPVVWVQLHQSPQEEDQSQEASRLQLVWSWAAFSQLQQGPLLLLQGPPVAAASD